MPPYPSPGAYLWAFVIAFCLGSACTALLLGVMRWGRVPPFLWCCIR